MIPIFMNVKHAPPDSYGDCFRACVASLLEVDDVPHFYFDGPDADVARERLTKYLRELHSLAPYIVAFPGDDLDAVLSGIEHDNPGIKFMLICGIAEYGAHAIVCGDGRVLHDPFYWPVMHDYEPIEGMWTILLFVPAVMYSGETS